VKYWEVIADNLSKAGFSLDWVSAIDSNGRTSSIADAHRDGKRFIVRADEKLTAFLEFESAIRAATSLLDKRARFFQNSASSGSGVRAGSFSPGVFFPFFRPALRRVNRPGANRQRK
jgi:hypothetical protein